MNIELNFFETKITMKRLYGVALSQDRPAMKI